MSVMRCESEEDWPDREHPHPPTVSAECHFCAGEVTLAPMTEEWRDHIPSGYEDQTGYGQVSCSCGWDSSDVLGWEQHINAADRMGRA